MRLASLSLAPLLAAGCVSVGDHGNAPATKPGPIDTTGCAGVVTEPGDLTITSDDAPDGVPDGCWALSGKLTLLGPAVTSVAGLGDLRSVHDLEIDATSLTALDVTTTLAVTGDIKIVHNTTLADLGKLAPSGQIRSLIVEYDDALTGLGGLAQVTGITGDTAIDNDGALTDIDLAAATTLGGVAIDDDPALTKIELPAATSVGSVAIANNPALTSLDSMSALTAVHGSLLIGNNAALPGLGGLGATLGSIDQNLLIIGNGRLSELGQLAHAGGIGGSVEIANNSQLDYCAAAAIGCCVSAASVQILDNLSSSCSSGNAPWCWTEQDGCPYGN